MTGCYAKYDAVLLVGSNAVKINSSFEVARIAHNIQNINFSFSKDIKFNRINFTNINDISLLDPNIEFSHKLKNQSFDNVDVLICIVSIAIIFYIIISCIKCIKFKAHCKLQSKNNNNIKSNSKVTDMHINNDNNSNSNSKDSVQIPSNNVDHTVIMT